MSARTYHVVALLILTPWLRLTNYSLAQDNRFEEAQSELAKDNFQGALNIYEKIIKDYQGNDKAIESQAHVGKSEVFQKWDNKYAGSAEKSLRDAITANPKDPDPPRRLARFYEGRGKVREAIGQYETVIKLADDDTTSIKKLIEFYEKDKRFQKVADMHEKLSELQPENPEVHLKRGLALLKANKTAEAAVSFRKAVEQNPEFFVARLELARCYEILEIMEIAKQEYAELLRYFPNSTEAQSGLKRIETLQTASAKLNNINDIDGLTLTYNELESLHKSYPHNNFLKNLIGFYRGKLFDLWLQKGDRLADKLGQAQNRIKAYETALSFALGDSEREKKSNDAIKNANVDRTVEAKLDYIERRAIETLNEALILKGKVLSKAEMDLKKKKLNEAAQGFIAISVIDPRRQTVSVKQKQAEVESWYVLGLLALENEAWEQAGFYFSQVLNSDSSYLDIKARFREAKIRSSYKLGLQAIGVKNLPEAMFYFSQVEKIDPVFFQEIRSQCENIEKELEQKQNTRMLTNLGTSAYQEKDFIVAEYAFEKLLQINRDDTSARQNLNNVDRELSQQRIAGRALKIFSILLIVLVGILFWDIQRSQRENDENR